MNVKRTAIFGVGGGALAAWFAAAATSGHRQIPIVPIPSATRVELRGAELAAEIVRLRERLRPTTAPHHPARDLFRFEAADAPRSLAAAVERPLEIPAAPAPAPPPFRLIGIAEDQEAAGPVRTAILSGRGDVFLVRPGETVGGYRVGTVSPDGVELTELSGRSTTFRLVLP